MENNFSLKLTNADLVEVDEYLVKKLNADAEDNILDVVDKASLLNAAENWIRIDEINEENFFPGNLNYFCRVFLGSKFKNRRFEVCFRKRCGNIIRQHINIDSSNNDGVLVIPIPVDDIKNPSAPDVVDIWYRLIMFPTQQYEYTRYE